MTNPKAGPKWIQDKAFLASVEQQWIAIRKFCRDSHRGAIVGGGLGGASYIIETPPDEFYNLPFVLAFAVLDDVLEQMIVEGVFSCTGARPPLGKKMEKSKGNLPWKNYAAVALAKDERNDLAHSAILQSKAECLRIVSLIEDELKGWNVI